MVRISRARCAGIFAATFRQTFRWCIVWDYGLVIVVQTCACARFKRFEFFDSEFKLRYSSVKLFIVFSKLHPLSLSNLHFHRLNK